MDELTQAQVKALLDYDHGTGMFRWRGSPRRGMRGNSLAGCVNSEGYNLIGINGKRYSAHRLAWLYVHGFWPDGQIDHINGRRDANNIKNLRVAKTDAEQQQNQKLRSNNASGYPGVCWDKRYEKWRATIRHHGKQEHLGYSDGIVRAAEAYREAKVRLHTFNPLLRPPNRSDGGR